KSMESRPTVGVCVAPCKGYPLVGGTRQRHFDGTNLKSQKLPENTQTPTRPLHVVLGGGAEVIMP
ncbi:MAG TPA: hypothetical protein VFM05_10715, partial [Candidatus Saccharimonadales bacterium]|nr:hypothetical protein [Candidatus Saccharimonadales bacterium]